jgi:CAAX prenyl protease-like protein
MRQEFWPRILPFAVFMGFIGIQEGVVYLVEQGWLSLSEQQLLFLYPLKALVVFGLLLFFYRRYSELNFGDFRQLGNTTLSLCVGVLVFILWINMDWDFATIGATKGFDPTLIENDSVRTTLIIFRLFGAALIVPIMEELFWRSFLLRYIINADFTKVTIGVFSWSSFLIGAALFGLEHSLILAGVMAGVAYSQLLYCTKSIAQCILAHAVTNLTLGIYVLQTGQWQFW